MAVIGRTMLISKGDSFVMKSALVQVVVCT